MPSAARLWRTLRRSAVVALTRLARENRQVWLRNPVVLWRFGARLVQAVTSFGWRGRFPGFTEVLRQTIRSFFRGLVVAVVLGSALGLALGSIADRFGVLIMPLLEQTVLIAVIRDGAPLVLAILMAARMGSSIVARLGDERQTRPPAGGRDFGPGEILHLVLPHLAAGLVTGWAFYRIGIFLVVPGYQSLGQFGSFLDGLFQSAFVPIDRQLALGRAIAVGQAKSALFGLIVAFTAAGLGLTTNEQRIKWPRRQAEALQSAVWGSGINALTMVMIVAFLFWQLQGPD